MAGQLSGERTVASNPEGTATAGFASQGSVRAVTVDGTIILDGILVSAKQFTINLGLTSPGITGELRTQGITRDNVALCWTLSDPRGQHATDLASVTVRRTATKAVYSSSVFNTAAAGEPECAICAAP